jgi:hypothetical protein
MKSKIWILQQVLRRNEDGSWSPKFDLTPLKTLDGEERNIVFIFGPGQIDLMPEAVQDAIEERLDGEGYDAESDFFVPTGNPVLSGPVYHAMMRRGGCTQLSWDGRYRTYTRFGFKSDKTEERYDGNN